MPTVAKSLPLLALVAAALCAGCRSQTPIGRAPRDLPAPNAAAPEAPPTAPAPASAPAAGEGAAPVNKLSEAYTLKVTGMTCRIVCGREVVAALKSVEGVTNVIIDYDDYKAIVHCKVGTNPDDLLAALKATGKYSGLVLPN
jgi:copper chaperone CopZ